MSRWLERIFREPSYKRRGSSSMSNQRTARHKAHFPAKHDLRPTPISLNGDDSWLLSFRSPESDHRNSGKAYFHIVHHP
ncbi:uncharacterized protein CC84DRAFT_665941 [Paraphaeosphaeria sporulosa]|uniref:Uncharacterized protein n=1 Tax=Paraphaeosphaeria sporulosa TaxID=1460663 RepID=A0A177CJV4_9PLEO|nr:uncharacterized protein CC84DRAFT_665941 [Paraphaeosphaeria sporulosa]OAG07531.1 hypothetical protein CC84DRAFT_665941 [Paraphaeosphaeria sporulosa]